MKTCPGCGYLLPPDYLPHCETCPQFAAWVWAATDRARERRYWDTRNEATP